VESSEQRTVNQPQQQAGSPDGERAAAPESARETAANGAPQAAAGTDEAALEGDVDELMKVAAQRDEYLALAQRTQADFENYRKRVARESTVALAKGVAKVVKELLPALDSLDRALEGAAQDDPLLEGVRLVRAELHGALERCGVESFSPLGEQFDPTKHEAIAQHAREQAPSGSVIEVYQAGYRMGDHIVRPARVVVAA
jgi:molecular chaperone GrpE